jgi:hypothetical protein
MSRSRAVPLYGRGASGATKIDELAAGILNRRSCRLPAAVRGSRGCLYRVTRRPGGGCRELTADHPADCRADLGYPGKPPIRFGRLLPVGTAPRPALPHDCDTGLSRADGSGSKLNRHKGGARGEKTGHGVAGGWLHASGNFGDRAEPGGCARQHATLDLAH